MAPDTAGKSNAKALIGQDFKNEEFKEQEGKEILPATESHINAG